MLTLWLVATGRTTANAWLSVLHLVVHGAALAAGPAAPFALAGGAASALVLAEAAVALAAGTLYLRTRL